MRPEIKAFYARVDQAHNDLFTEALRLESKLKSETDLEELCDWVLVMREAKAH